MNLILVSLFIVIISVIIHKIRSKQNQIKIFNVYSQPGKWYYLKYFLFLLILTTRKLKQEVIKLLSIRYKIFKTDLPWNEEDLEKLKVLSDHEKAFDAVFFQAVSQDGFYICGGTERRHSGKVNGLFYIATPEHGLLLSEKLPKTTLEADPVSLRLMSHYEAEGISFRSVSPMKHWKVSFEGKMRSQKEPDKLVDVKLKADWRSNFPYFLFDEEMSKKAIARAVAREEWSEELFKSLKEAHQTHYEQMGQLTGTLSISTDQYSLTLQSFRDHSFGFKRDWTLMHRYIFHILHLVDSTRISLGVVSQPSTTSHLELGFVSLPSGRTICIDSCDLLLYQHGEGGCPSKEIAFTLTAGGQAYEVEVRVEYEGVHFVGDDREARMVERFVWCRVNGVEGRGISEWHYNNLKEWQ